MSRMTVPGRAVQVLRLLDDHEHPSQKARQLKLDTQVLRDITGKVDKEGHPLAVIVIAGPERQGKSFMLTYFVRYLQALEESAVGVTGDWMERSNLEISMKGRGFHFENAFERTTEGIWMWSRPFIIPKPSNPNEKIAVLLMDTECCYGSSLTNQEQAALVGLSLLTSSIFICNETTRINDSTLATVGKFMQYRQLASQTFHRIMFLIRDWNCPSVFEYGAAGGQGLIREFFREKPRMTKETFEYRTAIMNHFEDCNAYLMPHPGQAVLSDKFSGSVAEMTPDFCYHLETFVTNLIADVAPKMLQDNLVTGSSFYSLFQAYVSAFNASDMPSPASILKATLYIAFDTEIRSLAGSYDSSLRKRIVDADNSGHMVTSQKLNQWGRQIADSVVSSFEKKEHKCAIEDKIFHIQRLKVQIDQIHNKVWKENKTFRNEFIQRSVATAYAAFQSFLEKHVGPDDRYWKRPEFDAKVNPAQEECLENFVKASSSVPSQLLQPMVTELSDSMNEIKETLWTELAARTTEAEKKANEIIKEILHEYISNMELLIADDVQPEATLERFHNKETNTAYMNFKCRIETQFKDAKFIMETIEKFNKSHEAEYMKIKGSNATKRNKIQGELDAEIRKALALFEEKSAQVRDIATADQSTLMVVYGSVLELALEAFERSATPDSQFLNEYVRKLRTALKAALDEAVASLVTSVEAKQLQCKQLAQNATGEFSKNVSSWMETTGTVSPGTFDERSNELMQNELSKCEADMRIVFPEYSIYLKDAQELMERSRLDSAATNAKQLEETDRFALQQSQITKRFYETSLERSLMQCKDLADLKKIHEEVSSQCLRQFRLELESCKVHNLSDSYEATCKKHIMESFNEKEQQFLHNTEYFKKRRIPEQAKDLQDRLGDKIGHQSQLDEIVDFINGYKQFYTTMPRRLKTKLKVSRNCDLLLAQTMILAYLGLSVNLITLLRRPERIVYFTSLLDNPRGLGLVGRMLFAAVYVYIWWSMCSVVHFIRIHTMIYAYAEVKVLKYLKNMRKGREDAFVRNSETLASLYRALQVLQVKFDNGLGVILAPFKLTATFLIIQGVYSRLMKKGSVSILSCFTGLMTWATLHVSLTVYGQLHEDSRDVLSAMKLKNTDPWFRRIHKSCRPLKIRVSKLYFCDRGLPLSWASFIFDSIVGLLVAT